MRKIAMVRLIALLNLISMPYVCASYLTRAEQINKTVSLTNTVPQPTVPAKITLDVEKIKLMLQQLPALEKTMSALNPKVGGILKKISEPTVKIVNLLDQVDKLNADFVKATEQAQNLPKYVACLKATTAQREGLSQAANMCRTLDCEDRVPCLLHAISTIESLLVPFIEDVVIGYQENGVQKNSVLVNLLELVKQPQINNKVDPLIKNTQDIMTLIREVKNILKIATEMQKEEGVQS